MDFFALSKHCAPTVDPETMAAIVKTESAFNPYAIGVVGGRLQRQPKNAFEATETIKYLINQNWNFSVGLAQVNHQHFSTYGLTPESAFDPCLNLKAGSKILEECYLRASKKIASKQQVLEAAFSCYYSGNFTRGFKLPVGGKSYVQKVLISHSLMEGVIPVISNNPDARLKTLKEVKPASPKQGEDNVLVFEPGHIKRDLIVF